jgi:undecaprenol kinase
MSRNQPLWVRMRFALNGILHAVRSERSMRTHVLAFGLMLIALVGLRPGPLWWAAFLLASFGVLSAELLNTAIEQLADLLHPGHHPRIRIAKDCAAGAVLLATLGAIGVAIAFLSQLIMN